MSEDAIAEPSVDFEDIKNVSTAFHTILDELEKQVIGQRHVVEELLVAVMSGGHCLLEGVPGLGKTLLVSSLAEAMDLSYKRIQFTPDLMPSDITGTEIIQENVETGQREYKFLHGPIFANIVLADEINRTPPKTQAALLEAMQEKQVSIGGTIYKLDKPFFILATQNPLEQEGTYPLPEAQQDRFLFKIYVDYPQSADECEIVRRVTERSFDSISAICGGEDILEMQRIVREIPVSDAIIDYANRLVRATRMNEADAPDFVKQYLHWGAGPRATINLVMAAKCFCAIEGKPTPSVDDVIRAVHPVLRHRIGMNYTGKAEGLTTDQIIDMLVEHVEKY
ncbi:MAG: MoxR family ATPase [Lentisphaeria bacterium]|nr:MoxR family ATPase [Lentisphaeria bacterium]